MKGEIMFNIGDKVWRASYNHIERFVTCPDCLGTKHVKVVLGDGTEVIIECGGCDPGGYKPSTGYIRQYDFKTIVSPFTVTGVNMVGDKGVEYQLDNYGRGSYYYGKDEDLFATEAEAMVEGERLKAAHEAEENKRLMAKTKDHRSWAWNATYHRREIKRLERDLEYHHSKVQICKAHVKEKK